MNKLLPVKKGEDKKQIRIFKNRILETFTKSSPLIAFAVYFPFIALFLAVNYLQNVLSFAVTLAVVLIGVFSWTFIEYILHRFIYHYITDSKLVQKIHYYVHGIHHRSPDDQERLIMPPVPGLIILSGFYLLFKLLLEQYVFVFLAGFLTGYLIYAFVHYCIHAYKPPASFLKKLWAHHSFHHYKDPNKCFGVSSPFWDIIFRTMPGKKLKE